MNTTFYYNSGMIVIHRTIPSEYIDSVAHDYRASRIEPMSQDTLILKHEEVAKEKMKLLTAVADYKKHRGTTIHTEQRAEFLSVLLKSRVPNWGDVHFTEL